VTLVARRREQFQFFFDDIFGCSTPSKKRCFSIQDFTRFCQRCRHSVEPRALKCPFKQNNLSAWSRQSLQALGEAFPLLYVVSCKLFWNWNDVVRFVSQEVWFDKGFVIWNFLNYCLVQTVSSWSFNIGVEIIFTTNELVDRIRNRDCKSNASLFKKKMYEKKDLSNKMRRRPDFWSKS